eukprot:12922336-Prorocentrum_lima.AAC.1
MNDMNRANKGSHWKTMVGSIKRAKSELQEETSSSASGSLQAKTQTKFKMSVLRMASELSEAVLGALLLPAFCSSRGQ